MVCSMWESASAGPAIPGFHSLLTGPGGILVLKIIPIDPYSALSRRYLLAAPPTCVSVLGDYYIVTRPLSLPLTATLITMFDMATAGYLIGT